jgi:hypothetical protein
MPAPPPPAFTPVDIPRVTPLRTMLPPPFVFAGMRRGGVAALVPRRGAVGDYDGTVHESDSVFLFARESRDERLFLLGRRDTRRRAPPPRARRAPRCPRRTA